MASLGDLIVRVGAEISGFTSAMKGVIDQVDEAADEVEDRLSGISDVGRRLATVGAEMTAAISLPLEEIGRHALEVAAQFEQTQVAFVTFTGSAASATQMLSDLYQFAATTPFQIPGLLSGARTLMAMQFAAKDIVPIMRTLGDTASGLGLGQEGLERLVFHLGQIRSEGSIDGRVLRELGMAGVNAGQMLADALGKSVPDIRKMISEKAIDATTAINALLKGMNEQFGGMMENQMSTLGGKWANFKDNITLTLVQIGDALLPVAKVILDFAQQATQGIKELAQWFAQLPAPVQATAGALLGIVAVAGPVLAMLGGIGIVIPGIVAVLGPIAAAIGISIAAMGGWATAIALAVAALTGLSVWVSQHWDGVRAAVVDAFQGVAEIWNSTIGLPVNAIISLFEWALAKTEPIWSAIGGIFKTTFDFIRQEAAAFWAFLKNDVLEPMFGWLEKIPGVMRLLSTGDAFKGADAAAQKARETAKAVSDAMSTLRLNGAQGVPQLTDPGAAWSEKHKTKIEEYTKALHTLEAAYKAGAIGADVLQKAQARLASAMNEKMPNFSTEPEAKGKAGAGAKVDHEALDKIKGAYAHQEAGFGLERSQVGQDYSMSKPLASENIEVEIAAAQKRKDALDKIAKEELAAALSNIDKELAVDKEGQSGHEHILAAKMAAQDKYAAELQKNGFELEAIKKQVNDSLIAEDIRAIGEEEKTRHKAYEDQVKTIDLSVEAMDRVTEGAQRHQQAMTSMHDRALQAQQEMGEITKSKYLRLKQEQYDEAYAIEMAAIAKERDLIERSFDALMDAAQTDAERAQITADYGKRTAKLDDKEQQATDRHASQTQDTKLTGQQDQYNTFFKPFESNFATGITSMIERTKTFGQAFRGMMSGMLNSWISSLAQMAARWVAHKAMELILHVGTEHAKTAATATGAAAQNAISIMQHIREMSRHAAEAAAAAWKATAGIPVVGPILAPIAAAATYVGVMAFGAVSAERGGVMPDSNTVAFLHPKEMVLPRPISEGLQSMFANGGNFMSNPNALTQVQGGGMSSSALQGLRGAASSGDTHNWGGLSINVKNTDSRPLTGANIFDMVQGEMRRRNLKMA